MIRFCDIDICCAADETYERKDHVVLDENIWENARYFFAHHQYKAGEHILLPVMDKSGQLICFAYEEAASNREIRMLRELLEIPEALQFSDIYPEFKCVRIYEFNELAYYFAKYLDNLHIAVEVSGELWQNFYDGSKCRGGQDMNV